MGSVKRVILVGTGGSGKDYLKRSLEEAGYTCSVSYTTRLPRVGETEGVDYYYINDGAFLSMIDNAEFREWNKFADKWYYGTSNVHFEKANLFIMTPSGISALSKSERLDSLVIYLDIPEDVRRERLSKRTDSDNPERRLDTDRIDFKDFKDFDWHVTDPNFDVDDILKGLKTAGIHQPAN